MITNEWSKMQASRKNAIEHKLFFIAFLLVGLNLANNAAGRPHGALPQGHDSDNKTSCFALQIILLFG